VAGGRGGRCGEAGAAVGVGVDQLAVLDDGHRGRGNAGLVKHLRGDAVDAGFEGGVEGVDRLSLRAGDVAARIRKSRTEGIFCLIENSPPSDCCAHHAATDKVTARRAVR
jgi:hypothetical protein